jgi:hypothetical protein
MLVTVGLILFRAPSLQDAWAYILRIVDFSSWTITGEFRADMKKLAFVFIMLILFTAAEWLGRKNEYTLATLGLNWNRFSRYSMYLILGLIIIFARIKGQVEEFIYFQF